MKFFDYRSEARLHKLELLLTKQYIMLDGKIIGEPQKSLEEFIKEEEEILNSIDTELIPLRTIKIVSPALEKAQYHLAKLKENSEQKELTL